MKKFIYLNSNKSGIGDRLTDLILVYTYSQYLNCEKLYLTWTEDYNDMVGEKSLYSKLRKNKTPFREVDYLLKNLLNFIILPSNIIFINQEELTKLSNEEENYIFGEYMGMNYTLSSFIHSKNIQNKEAFEKSYFDNFKKIKFKNIPENIINYFKNNDVVTIHLRRGDKVANDNGTTNNITENDLDNLNKLTTYAIEKLNKLNYRHFHFISDEKKARNNFIEKLKNKINCNYFDGDEISQTYYDLYSLAHSKKIILSQSFSVFSIFASIINQVQLLYLLNHPKMNLFSSYKNINKIDKTHINKNIKHFVRDINITKFDIKKYNFTDLVKKYYEEYFKTTIELDNLHLLLNSELISKVDKEYFNKIHIFGKTDRKSVFNKIFYSYYDSHEEFKNLYIKFIKEFIKPKYLPNEKFLVIQKTPNIRQQLPNATTLGKLYTDKDNTHIGVHIDYDFGHNENEYNFILPITKMFETNSIFFEPYPNSKLGYDKYLTVNQNIDELGIYYFNKCKHYNKINLTNKTRISFDFRIIPYSKYLETEKKTITTNSKLIIGDYFIKLDC